MSYPKPETPISFSGIYDYSYMEKGIRARAIRSLRDLKDCCAYPVPCIHFGLFIQDTPLFSRSYFKPRRGRFFILKSCSIRCRGWHKVRSSCPMKVEVVLDYWLRKKSRK